MSIASHIKTHIRGIIEVPFSNPIRRNDGRIVYINGITKGFNRFFNGYFDLERINRRIDDFFDSFHADLFNMAVVAMALARILLIETKRNLAFNLESSGRFVAEGAYDFSVHEHDNNLAGTFNTNVAKFVLVDGLSGRELLPFGIGTFAPGIDHGSVFNLDHPGKAASIDTCRGYRIDRIIFDRHICIDRKIFVLECRIDFDRGTVVFRRFKLPRFNNGMPKHSQVGFRIRCTYTSNLAGFNRSLVISHLYGCCRFGRTSKQSCNNNRCYSRKCK